MNTFYKFNGISVISSIIIEKLIHSVDKSDGNDRHHHSKNKIAVMRAKRSSAIELSGCSIGKRINIEIVLLGVINSIKTCTDCSLFALYQSFQSC